VSVVLILDLSLEVPISGNLSGRVKAQGTRHKAWDEKQRACQVRRYRMYSTTNQMNPLRLQVDAPKVLRLLRTQRRKNPPIVAPAL
jgi:hypothetical protein